MSENKLDKSLDDILSTRRKTGGRRTRGRRAVTASTRATKAAPVGGVQKSTRANKGATKAAGTAATTGSGDTKIIVSNLPSDVNEAQIKEYFGKSVGTVKRAMLTYGPNGISRGIATIIFNKAGDANKAHTKLSGVLVDKRPMRIEVVLDANKPAPSKGLDERTTQPNSAKPKPATDKATTGTTAGRGGRGRGRGGRGGRTARPKKTADELDAEMVDYFDANAANGAAADSTAATNGTAAAGGEELGMEEIS